MQRQLSVDVACGRQLAPLTNFLATAGGFPLPIGTGYAISAAILRVWSLASIAARSQKGTASDSGRSGPIPSRQKGSSMRQSAPQVSPWKALLGLGDVRLRDVAGDHVQALVPTPLNATCLGGSSNRSQSSELARFSPHSRHVRRGDRNDLSDRKTQMGHCDVPMTRHYTSGAQDSSRRSNVQPVFGGRLKTVLLILTLNETNLGRKAL